MPLYHAYNARGGMPFNRLFSQKINDPLGGQLYFTLNGGMQT